ncbi:MAG TPA: MarR family transcriptional regulator [Nocardioides sp.]|nr:MarR family transcriptional regulator [Nocardioides sp.]
MTDLISGPLPAAPHLLDAAHTVQSSPYGWAEVLDQHSWRSLVVGLALLVERLDHNLRRDHRLTFEEYTILSAISDAPHGMSLEALGRSHPVSRMRLGPVLTRMQVAGWLLRQSGPWQPDSRVWVTPAGVELVERAAPGHVAGLREYFLDHVDPDEFQVMARAFDRVRSALIDASA